MLQPRVPIASRDLSKTLILGFYILYISLWFLSTRISPS